MILQPQVVAFGLLLLQTGAVFSTQVNAVVGQSVTLPCIYSGSRGVTSMCWGRGPCPYSQCSNTLIKMDAHLVTYQKDRRHQLKGRISQGDVSLTIETVNMGDSGQYCCHINVPGWFNDIKKAISLNVMPEITPPVPTKVVATQPTTLQEMKTLPILCSQDSCPAGTCSISLNSLKAGQVFVIARPGDLLRSTAPASATILAAGLWIRSLGSLISIAGDKEDVESDLITLANLPASGFANAVAEGIRSEENIYTIEENIHGIEENIYSTEENIYTIEENIYSTEENIYEVEDPDEHYCSASRGQ
ncbi:hepatitis A virus cellular receptor 2 homolog [Erethizon dorsatum]